MSSDKPLTQLTDDELLEKLRVCSNGDLNPVKREIDRRIRAKNNQPHPSDCICTDCTRQE